MIKVSRVPNIWFFGSRILTLQFFWLTIFVIAKIVVALASFGEKKSEIGCIVFVLISMGGAEKIDLPLKLHQNNIIYILLQLF